MQEQKRTTKNTSVNARETWEQENISVMDTEFWEDKAAANVQTYGNIRTSASDKGQVAGVILPGCQADVLGTVGGWTRIRSGRLQDTLRPNPWYSGRRPECIIKMYMDSTAP